MVKISHIPLAAVSFVVCCFLTTACSVVPGPTFYHLCVSSGICGGGPAVNFDENVNRVTEAVVSGWYGSPARMIPLQEGGESWIYYLGTLKACDEYILQFNTIKVLKKWSFVPGCNKQPISSLQP